MRRPEFFLALGRDHDVDRERPLDGDNRLERVQERALRSFLVGRATSHEHPAEFVIDDLGVERRALPVVRIDGLHVVHQVDDERALGAGVVVSPDTGVSVGRHEFRLGESEVGEVLPQHLGHVDDAHVLRGDRRLAQPALQGREVLVGVRIDVLVDGRVFAVVRGDRADVVRRVGR